MAAQSDTWPQARPDLMRAIVRRNDTRGGGVATTARMASDTTRHDAPPDLAQERADRDRMMTAIRRLGGTR